MRFWITPDQYWVRSKLKRILGGQADPVVEVAGDEARRRTLTLDHSENGLICINVLRVPSAYFD
jgi:hypothetical protein